MPKLSDRYRYFDGMCWPAVNESVAELEWTLRYGTRDSREANRYFLASVVGAYVALVHATQKKRNEVCKRILEGDDAKAK